MSDKPSWKTIGKVNGAFIKAMVALGAGWLFWRMAVPGFDLFGAYGAIFAIGGVALFCAATYQLIRTITKSLTWGRFKAKGKDPKADPMASETDLDAKGLTR